MTLGTRPARQTVANAVPRAPQRFRRATDCGGSRTVLVPPTKPSARAPSDWLDGRATSAPVRPSTGVVTTFGLAGLAELLDPMLPPAAGAERGPLLLLVRIDVPVALDLLCGIDGAEAFGRRAADRLRALVRRTDHVIRLDLCRVALVLTGCGSEAADTIAARIAQRFASEPIVTSAGPLRASLKIGVSSSGAEPRSAMAWVQAAADALDDGSAAPSASASSAAALARETAAAVLAAFDRDDLVLATQPIVSARTREVFCYEALVRVRTAEGTLLQPAVTMPMAERTGLISRIDARVLALAVARLDAEPALRLTVNLSLGSTRDDAWIEEAERLLDGRRELAARLIVEITESAALDDLDATKSLVRRIKALGASVALDDFGAGHSSFRALRQLDVDLLKIDGAFIRTLPQSEEDAAFVQALVALARHLRIPTVAEFVEDEATATLLAACGVDYLQGHLFGRATV